MNGILGTSVYNNNLKMVSLRSNMKKPLSMRLRVWTNKGGLLKNDKKHMYGFITWVTRSEMSYDSPNSRMRLPTPAVQDSRIPLLGTPNLRLTLGCGSPVEVLSKAANKRSARSWARVRRSPMYLCGNNGRARNVYLHELAVRWRQLKVTHSCSSLQLRRYYSLILSHLSVCNSINRLFSFGRLNIQHISSFLCHDSWSAPSIFVT